jgi:predicted ArsR family transcriptional regulator
VGIDVTNLPISKRRLLMRLKTRGPATIAELAADLRLSGEAIRQQLAPLERELWIEREALPPSGEPGRPPGRYRLTLKGEGLFPKQTGTLAVAFADAIREEMGDQALEQILAHVTDARVLGLQGNRTGTGPEAPLSEKVGSLRGIYGNDDAFVDVEKVHDGYRLIERNCPFLDVALARPVLCSSTVTTLTRLAGRKVVREERFQDGHGFCAFRIYEDQPVDVSRLRFAREPERDKPGT